MTAMRTTPFDRYAGACPPVIALQLGRILRLDGRRLGLLGGTTLQVECSCGHSSLVPIADLVSRHGHEARVRDTVTSMRCAGCGGRHIKEVHWLGECVRNDASD